MLRGHQSTAEGESMGKRRFVAGRGPAGLLMLALAIAACSDSNRDVTTGGRTSSMSTAEATTAVAVSVPPSDPTTGATAPVVASPTTEVIEQAAPSTASDGSVVAEFAGAPWFLGRVPAGAIVADDSLEPIKLGMINQENTPVGSYPELRVAVEAAMAWANAELGGVDGHPIELHACITTFDAERSRTCAHELVDAGVVALVGGVDVMSDGSYPVIEQNGLASFGGIPANLTEQRSPNAFFFSGGDAGALAGFMAHAVEQGRSTVALVYGSEVESFVVAARDYGAAVGRSLGMEVALIPFSMFDTDYAPVMTEAQRLGADAVMVLAATSACVPVVQAVAAVELDAQLYLTGACASEATIRSANEAGVAVVWNAEGPVDGVDVEASLYQAVIDRYAEAPAGGAGTVGFRGFMNLYALLLQAGGDDVSSGVLSDLARADVDRPSFWGHPYTCDGEQVPGLRALCAPQQVLFTVAEDGSLVSLTGWIPTDEVFAASIG